MENMKFDNTLDDVQNSIFNNTYAELIRLALRNKKEPCPFSEIQLKHILLIYHKFILRNNEIKPTSFLTRKQFLEISRNIFNIQDEKLAEQVLNIYGSSRHLSPTGWIHLIGVYAKGSLQEKIEFCFKIYDIENTKKLTREIVKRHVKGTLIGGSDEDGLKEIDELEDFLVDQIIEKFDLDCDGSISLEDYRQTVVNCPLLLEFLGQCLPSNDALAAIGGFCNLVLK